MSPISPLIDSSFFCVVPATESLHVLYGLDLQTGTVLSKIHNCSYSAHFSCEVTQAILSHPCSSTYSHFLMLSLNTFRNSSQSPWGHDRRLCASACWALSSKAALIKEVSGKALCEQQRKQTITKCITTCVSSFWSGLPHTDPTVTTLPS